jgi:Tol biopolymer transport system component
MSLTAGARLGPYEIQSPLGAGGMGEVYRARDPRLGRDVAIKVLPASLTNDADRLARFSREAQVLAALNHPNIAAIYHVEEADGASALVMELVEGEDLSQRIARGRIPLDEALPIAKQIAEALEAAHEQGIIHRDLKPANIKVRPDGTVKVLDFGLAKLSEPSAVSATSPAALSMSPTITSPALMSGAGVLLGTAAYMAPEQARGRTVDKRSDIWAFGCVLYEMLTGRQAFTSGETVSDTLAAILTREPEWGALPTNTPARILALLERCLRKDPRRRLQDIGDARIETEDAQKDPAPAAASIGSVTSRHREYAWAAVALIFLLAAVLLGARLFLAPAPDARTVQFQVEAPESARIDIGEPLSPDGRTIAFIAISEGGQPLIWVRPLDSAAAHVVPGTEQAQRLFWSPDSRYIGFFAHGKLKKVAVTGGPPVVICNEAGRDGAWGSGDVILIGGQPMKPLLRVSAAGGQPVAVTALGANEVSHDYPDFLPDGRHFLFMARTGSAESFRVYVASLDSKERRVLPGIAAGARYSPTGHVLFARDGTLMAQSFDVGRQELSGEPFPVAEGVRGPVKPYSVSTNGTLAYLTGGLASDSQLAWFDRSGKQLAPIESSRQYTGPELSPDGKYVAFARGQPTDIWVLDIAKGLTSRLTSDPAGDAFPVWSPDGRTVAFGSNREGGTGNLYMRTVGAVEQDRLLLKSEEQKRPSDWTRDGRYLVYTAGRANNDIWALPLSGGRSQPLRVTETPFSKQNPRVSPDGQWIAYSSDETGESQVYVQSFPQSTAKQQVSTTGGFQPSWSRDRRELFYIRPDFTLMAVSVKPAGAALEVSPPASLFRPPFDVAGPLALTRNYSVSGDGRFLINVSSTDPLGRPITVVLNWAATLKK